MNTVYLVGHFTFSEAHEAREYAQEEANILRTPVTIRWASEEGGWLVDEEIFEIVEAS